jgi:hypothetical protein
MTAKINVHHHKGKIVEPRLLTPNGFIEPFFVNTIEGFKYRKNANKNKNNDKVHKKGLFRRKFSIIISLLKFKCEESLMFYLQEKHFLILLHEYIRIIVIHRIKK